MLKMRNSKTKNIFIKILLVGLVMGVLEQPVSAYIFDAEQQQHQAPYDVTFDYDFKYSPETSSSQVADADEIDNSNYDLYDGNVNSLGYNFNNNAKRSAKIHVYRRGCIRRNGACDHRPKDCCYNSSCRCNLWGSNCRCQRMGLFQKWG